MRDRSYSTNQSRKLRQAFRDPKTLRQRVLDAVNDGGKTADVLGIRIGVGMRRVSATLCYLEGIGAVRCTGRRMVRGPGNPAKEYEATRFRL